MYVLGWVEFLGFLEDMIVATIRVVTVDSGFVLKVEPTGYPQIGCKGWKENRNHIPPRCWARAAGKMKLSLTGLGKAAGVRVRVRRG